MPALNPINQLLDLSRVHEQWREPLSRSLQQVDTDYLQQLLDDDGWLPGKHCLLAAFQRDLSQCRYILFGESPYPRAASANGIAFYDAAVSELWSENGLSKAVNRATSLRNIMKTALLAEGRIQPSAAGKVTQPDIARVDKHALIQTIGELFANLQQHGFLMFNATPVLHPARKPAVEARYWHRFIDALLTEIERRLTPPPTLVLWGKIAQQILSHPVARDFPAIVCEHPYNLSFIENPQMQALFAHLHLLDKSAATKALPEAQ